MQLLAAWLVLPAGSRWSYILLAALGVVAGGVSGIPAWRSDDLFFIVVSSWAIVSGGIEILAGIRSVVPLIRSRATRSPSARSVCCWASSCC